SRRTAQGQTRHHLALHRSLLLHSDWRNDSMRHFLSAILLFTGLFTPSGSAASAQTTPRAGNAQVTLKWLGTAGWEISDGSTFLLIDPYVSRILGFQPSGRATYK